MMITKINEREKCHEKSILLCSFTNQRHASVCDVMDTHQISEASYQIRVNTLFSSKESNPIKPCLPADRDLCVSCWSVCLSNAATLQKHTLQKHTL